MRYWPVSSVTTDLTFSMSAGLAASTVTPGRTAPDASLTTPAIDACAYAIVGSTDSEQNTMTIRVARRIAKAPSELVSSRSKNGLPILSYGANLSIRSSVPAHRAEHTLCTEATTVNPDIPGLR